MPDLHNIPDKLLNQRHLYPEIYLGFFIIQQEVPTFRDFTIRDPRYFVILFSAPICENPRHFVILQKKKKIRGFFWKISFFFSFFA